MFKPRIETLSFELIRTDGGTQSRRRIDPDRVKDLSEDIADIVKVKPPKVMFDGEDYWLWSGWSRFAAEKLIGWTEGPFLVEDGTREDAVIASCAENSPEEFGMPRSRSDTRMLIIKLHELKPKWVSRTIAKHCKCSHSHVCVVLNELRDSDSLKPSSRPVSGSPLPGQGSLILESADSVPIDPDLERKIRDTPKKPFGNIVEFVRELESDGKNPRRNVPSDCGTIDILTDDAAYKFVDFLQPSNFRDAYGYVSLWRSALNGRVRAVVVSPCWAKDDDKLLGNLIAHASRNKVETLLWTRKD